MRLQRFFPGIALVGVMALALGSSIPAASAASASSYVTRGQYVEQLLTAVGIQPDNSTAQSFSDVSPSNPYFGYVEAAYKAGITTGMTAPSGSSMGVFGVNDNLNRAEAAAFDLRAYDGGVATYAQGYKSWTNSTYNPGGVNPNSPQFGVIITFNDYAAIPSALQGDVYIASTIGLLHGFPNGTFGPLENLTSAQIADLIAQLKAVEKINGGSYNWRWIASASSMNATADEARAVNAMAFFAAAIQGKPFSAVSSYINQSDASSVQTAYTAIQKAWQQNYVSKAPSIVWKIVGGGYSMGGFENVPTGYVDANDSLQLEATTASGAPVNLQNVMGIGGAGGPYVMVSLSNLVTDTNGLIVSVGSSYINNDSSMIVATGESVAGVTMGYVGEFSGLVTSGGTAIAVVAGKGQAYQGVGQNIN